VTTVSNGRQQEVSKKIVDAQHPEVKAWRHASVKGVHVFRVCPKGVSRQQISKRVNGLGEMLSMLGSS